MSKRNRHRQRRNKRQNRNRQAETNSDAIPTQPMSLPPAAKRSRREELEQALENPLVRNQAIEMWQQKQFDSGRTSDLTEGELIRNTALMSVKRLQRRSEAGRRALTKRQKLMRR